MNATLFDTITPEEERRELSPSKGIVAMILLYVMIVAMIMM